MTGAVFRGECESREHEPAGPEAVAAAASCSSPPPQEFEREQHAHSVLRFQFAEVKEALKQREEMLEVGGGPFFFFFCALEAFCWFLTEVTGKLRVEADAPGFGNCEESRSSLTLFVLGDTAAPQSHPHPGPGACGRATLHGRRDSTDGTKTGRSSRVIPSHLRVLTRGRQGGLRQKQVETKARAV